MLKEAITRLVVDVDVTLHPFPFPVLFVQVQFGADENLLALKVQVYGAVALHDETRDPKSDETTPADDIEKE